MAPIHIPNEFWMTMSFLGFIMCAIPFPWHLEAWNTGTCLLMAWVGLANLNQFINAVVWNGNAINWAPVWCDISTRIFLGAIAGIPACFLCINRRLYQMASIRRMTVTRAEKRRAVMVDLAIGLGIPIIYMTLHYIVQGHRFNIAGDIGCFPATYMTPVAIVLYHIPPILLGFISACYSVLSIRAFAKRRRQFNELLSGCNNLNSGRYLRLMMFAGIETCLTTFINLFSVFENCVVGTVHPWLGWADTHYDFSRVDQIPAVIWRSDAAAVRALEFNRFVLVLSACFFFAFFGFAEESRKHYRSGVQYIAKFMGILVYGSFCGRCFGPKSKGTVKLTFGSGPVPVFVERRGVQKRDSLAPSTDTSVSYSSSFGEDEKGQPVITAFISHDDIKLPDFGSVLADYKKDTISPTPSSGSSASNFPIEVSSVRNAEAASAPNLALPEAVHPISRHRNLSDSSPV